MNLNKNYLVRIAFGIIVIVLAFNAFASLYTFVFHNIYSPIASKDLAFANNEIVDAFSAQVNGYRLAMFVVAVVAFFSNRASYINIISLGILVLSSYQLSYMLFHGFYELQTIVATLFILLAGYCFINTKGSKGNNA
jgi:hypothetical protein